MSDAGCANNLVFEYYSNSWTKQQYSYSVFQFSQYRIVFGIPVFSIPNSIRYSSFLNTEQNLVFGIWFFWQPEQYSGIEIVGPNTCPNIFTYFQNEMSCMEEISFFQFNFFKTLYTIWYLIFGIRIVQSSPQIFVTTDYVLILGIFLFFSAQMPSLRYLMIDCLSVLRCGGD